jgi:hypothetical protein
MRRSVFVLCFACAIGSAGCGNSGGGAAASDASTDAVRAPTGDAGDASPPADGEFMLGGGTWTGFTQPGGSTNNTDADMQFYFE